MKKLLIALCLAGIASTTICADFAKADEVRTGKITPKTVGAAALSLIIWPGIGQAVNENDGEKVFTHAVLGLFVPYRFWSAYDACVDREGGYWEGRI